jgi:hypothetical protein
MLRNQLEDLLAEDVESATETWREALEAEIAAMEADRLRLPWIDDLPSPIEQSLAPFRDRLEQSYSEQCSALEFGLGQD